MPESNVGEFTSPLSGDTKTIEGGQKDVEKSLPAFETFVGQSPDAVQTVDTVRFSDDVIEMEGLKSVHE